MTSEGRDGEIVRTGGCQCGAIRYRITGEPRVVSVCHCTDCQRQSGGAFSMSMVVRREQLELTSGEPACFEGKSERGTGKHAHFCPRCGNRIFNTLESMPDTVNVKPGTLDDTRFLQPVLQVWTDSRQPWLSLDEPALRFPRNPSAEGLKQKD